MSKQAFGWLIEVSSKPGTADPGEVRRYMVAEPVKRDALDTVRRRVQLASESSVEAVSMLSRTIVYTTMRMKRGDLVQIA